MTGEFDLDVALRRIISTCRSDLHRHHNVVLTSSQPEGIHQTRVVLRRLRASLGLSRDAIDNSELRGIDSEARWLSDECGPARDLHVFLTDVTREIPRPISRVGARLAAAPLARARKALGGTRFARFDCSLESFILAPPSYGRETLTTFASRAFEVHYAKVLRCGRHISRLKRQVCTGCESPPRNCDMLQR